MENIQFTGEFFVPGSTDKRIEVDHLERYSFAQKYAKDKSVLDIACGYGYGGEMMSRAGAKKYVGVDINKELIINANKKYSTDKVIYQQSDVCTYQPDKKYDLIISFETIEHIKDYQQALNTMRKSLAPGGKIIISSPNRPVTSPHAKSLDDKPENKYHAQEFTINELLEAMGSAGFDIRNAEIYGQRLSFLHFKNRFLRKIISILGLNPNINTSATPKKFKNKIPRYFIIVAG